MERAQINSGDNARLVAVAKLAMGGQMIKQINRIIALAAAFVVFSLPAWADANSAANRLFVEAIQALKHSEQMTSDSLEMARKRVDLLTLVNENLNQIISDYPSSNLAVQLLIGPVGPVDLSTLPTMLLEAEMPIIRFRADEQLDVVKTSLANNEMFQAQTALINASILTARQIEDADDRSFPLYLALREQIEISDIPGAIRTAQYIDSVRYRSVALALITIAQFEAGDVSDALSTFQNIDDAAERSTVLVSIVEAQAKESDVSEALSTAQEINDAADRSHALMSIASAQLEVGDVSDARATIASALREAQSIDDDADRSRALIIIVMLAFHIDELGE